MSERVCVKTSSMSAASGKRESPRWTGVLFLLGSFCSASDLISALPARVLGLGLSGSPVEKVRSGEKKKVDSERLADKAPTRLGLFCVVAAKFDPVSPESYQDSINQKESQEISLWIWLDKDPGDRIDLLAGGFEMDPGTTVVRRNCTSSNSAAVAATEECKVVMTSVAATYRRSVAS